MIRILLISFASLIFTISIHPNDIPQVGVLAYSLRTKRYLVQRSNTGLSWRHPQGKSLSNATDYTAANAGDCKDGNRVSVLDFPSRCSFSVVNKNLYALNSKKKLVIKFTVLDIFL